MDHGFGRADPIQRLVANLIHGRGGVGDEPYDIVTVSIVVDSLYPGGIGRACSGEEWQ